ncbi:hypothetical protein PNEG_01735 [Pneumocystis murina B123]|uniref:Uncharacterized protein n=1 Tax=Pneumocystis murina (strain B123) TaxID=1069680 RepID=M7NS81_PNEMU|nr:hypothetical protein PNEG_01735 [Pneumocystis murina B123]EMR09976.1 hypothetical protein PNEG_01735 [Pneumocystis murina B123]
MLLESFSVSPTLNVISFARLNISNSITFLSEYLQTSRRINIDNPAENNVNESLETQLTFRNANINAQLYKIQEYLKKAYEDKKLLKRKKTQTLKKVNKEKKQMKGKKEKSYRNKKEY